MIKIRNLSKTVKKRKILNNINADLVGITGIIGSNGAGKSTLIKILASIIEGDRGTEIHYNNKDKGHNIGYLPQDFTIYPDLTVINVLTLLAQLKNQYDRPYLEELISSLNLTKYKNQKMKTLSGGTLRRVGIAQALLSKPSILIIDEPTTGLDILECINLRNSLLNISKKNIQIVISSHIPTDITSICNHLIVINEGSKIFEGKIEELETFSNGLTFEAVLDKTDLSLIREEETILNVEQLPGEKLKVQILSHKNQVNPIFKQTNSNFLSGYVALLKRGEFVG